MSLTLTALGLTAKKVVSGVWAFAQTKVGQYLIFAAILAGSLWYAHHRGVETTEDKYEAKIAQMVADQKAKDKSVEDAQRLALKTQKDQSDKLVADLELQLQTEKDRRKTIRTIIKEVKTYVTKDADARAVIPVGFVFVHNAAIDVDLAGSPPADPDASSGVTLSTVAEVVATNYDECVLRGQIIDTWQTWYAREKVIFENAAAQSVPYTPTPPPDPEK